MTTSLALLLAPRGRQHQATAIKQWFADLRCGTDDAKPVGASVVRRTHYVLNGILTDAVTDNLIAKNPAKGIRLPATNRKRTLYLAHEQVRVLAAAHLRL
jgi:hypothetical protein